MGKTMANGEPPSFSPAKSRRTIRKFPLEPLGATEMSSTTPASSTSSAPPQPVQKTVNVAPELQKTVENHAEAQESVSDIANGVAELQETAEAQETVSNDQMDLQNTYEAAGPSSAFQNPRVLNSWNDMATQQSTLQRTALNFWNTPEIEDRPIQPKAKSRRNGRTKPRIYPDADVASEASPPPPTPAAVVDEAVAEDVDDVVAEDVDNDVDDAVDEAMDDEFVDGNNEEDDFVPPNVVEHWEETDRLKKLTPWSRQELDTLYNLLNLYGTSDEAIEFIAENGMDKPLEEIQIKMKEIRQLVAEAKTMRMKAFAKHYEAKTADVLENEDLAEEIPIDEGPLGGVTNQWSAAALQLSGQFRQFNHSIVRNAITSALDAVPPTRYDAITATTSALAKRPGTMDSLDFGKIVTFLKNVNSQTTGANNVTDLSALESAVLLQIYEEIAEEARDELTMKQKAVVRGLLRTVKAQDFGFFNPDTPCNEFSATQAYIDPFRTRDWNIPIGGRKLTREYVDARRPPGHPDAIEEDDDDEEFLLSSVGDETMGDQPSTSHEDDSDDMVDLEDFEDDVPFTISSEDPFADMLD